MNKKILYLVFGVLLFAPVLVLAEMSSSTYSIYADTISIGGGLSDSATYSLNTTGGEVGVGSITSSTYEIKGGFQFMDLDSTLTFDLVSTSIDLGTLSTSSVSQATSTAIISTDNENGYSLSITDVSGTSIAGVSDGTVSPGSEEYGIGLVGTNRSFVNDQAIVASLNIASSTSAVSSDQIDIVFKASIDSSTTADTYSQSITFTTSVNP